MQIVYFAPIACLTTCLSVAYSGLRLSAKLAIGVLLSIVSTFSSANGVLCWVLVLPVLLVVCDWRRPFVPFLIAGWMALCLLSVSFYLYGYRTPEWHPSLTESLRHPVRALAYLAAFLGAPLAPGSGIPHSRRRYSSEPSRLSSSQAPVRTSGWGSGTDRCASE